MKYRVGDWVEVGSAAEILAAVDAHAETEGIPFMPEMLPFLGRRFRVMKRADKACDTIERDGIRRMTNCVHLDLRCTGCDHGNCEAACLLFWKEAWLKKVEGDAGTTPLVRFDGRPDPALDQLRELVAAAAVTQTAQGPRYSCQATEMRKSTTVLPWWDLRQYARDLWSGNARLGEVLRGALVALYNKIQERRRGAQYPFIEGKQAKTPKQTLDLQAGEWVEVKSKAEIMASLDRNLKNRGLTFDREMVPYCGQKVRVLKRVKNIINEKTGFMMKLPGDCIILEGVVCQGSFHRFCPRAIYPYWREIWLKRVPAPFNETVPKSQDTKAQLECQELCATAERSRS